MKSKIKVWDVPTRLFHWLLVLALLFMWQSAKSGGMMVWHLRCGLLITALLVFRLCWGIWGSDTARFSQFVRGPSEIRRYLRQGIPEEEQPGHNPLGALMVVALLAAALFQTATGLLAADENTFTDNGYLNRWVSADAGSFFRYLHVNAFNVLAALAAVHIAAVLLYRIVGKKNLILPMLTGYKTIDAEGVKNVRFASFFHFLAALGAAAAVAFGIWLLGQ